MPEATIRPARELEIDQVGDLWAEMYAGQRDQGMLLQLAPDALQIWKSQLPSRLDSPVSVILVAEHDGRLDGFLAAQIKRLPPHYAATSPKVGFISEAFVRPAARRGHLGSRLVDVAFAWFDRSRVSSVELHVLIHNEAGRRFWESKGFVSEILQMRVPRS